MSKGRLIHRLGLVGRLVALVGTSYFLIATSRAYEPGEHYQPQSCNHAAETVTFHVAGSCGPEGDITAVSATNDCAIAVRGAGVLGLPSAGRFSAVGTSVVSLKESAWTISGYLPEAASAALADAGIFTVVPSDASAIGKPDAAVFTASSDSGVSGLGHDAGVFTVGSDARTDAIAAGTGGSGGFTTGHVNLAVRTCWYLPGSTPGLSCSGTNASACQATLTPR